MAMTLTKTSTQVKSVNHCTEFGWTISVLNLFSPSLSTSLNYWSCSKNKEQLNFNQSIIFKKASHRLTACYYGSETPIISTKAVVG